MKTLAIVTTTYNRANLLQNAFKSLTTQTVKDFVWYVIDDGSEDNTEDVITKLKEKADFQIIYSKKENGGKHTALNLAFDLVKEELIVVLDSDDELMENAVKTILKDYVEIKEDSSICGLGYLRSYKDLKNVGKPYTKDGIIDNFTNQRLNKNVYGDKCEVYKTKVLKNYKFPEFKGERFLSEAAVWCKISLDYKMKFFNKSFYCCEYLEGGLSDNVHKRLFENPKGAVECYYSMSSKQAKLKPRIKYTVAYTVYSFAAKIKAKQQFKRVSSKFIYILTFIPAWIIYLNKKRRYKR
ncbi:MAG: glycosyltransferase family 2 protein [Clostridia bacterium]|nr:glycosyltransferase family 2 protein [Clostridia bacterium]